MEVGTPMGDSALRPIALPGLLECLLLPPCPKTHFASSADELSHTLRVKCLHKCSLVGETLPSL